MSDSARLKFRTALVAVFVSLVPARAQVASGEGYKGGTTGRSTKGTKPAGTKPAGTKPAGTKPAGTKPAGTKPAGTPSAWNPTTFANVLVGLPQAYYDPKRLRPKRAFRSAMARLETAVPEVVAHRPDGKGAIRLTAGGQSRSFGTADLSTWMGMGDRLLKVLRWVDGVLGDRSDRDLLQYAAIKGALDVLDPHTTFFTPDEYRSNKSRFTGSVVGVGVYLRTVEGRIVVRKVLARGPAARAGVRAGDVLVQVGALTMANLNPTIASERLRGKAGTKVKLVVERRGRRMTFVVTRKEIVLPSVTTRMLAGGVALITITGFPKNVLAGFKKELAAIRKRRPKAYLLDLRGNEGGYIQQAVRMADFFLESGVLVKAIGRGGQKKVTWEVKKRKDRITAPVLVFINRRTASAAEILAGALSTAGRTLLVGEKTWGKGTVQKLFPMKDGSALKLTMWQYLLRGDIPVQTAAIVPDVEVVGVRITDEGVRYLTAARSSGEAGQARVISAMKGKEAWRGRPVMKKVRYLADAGADPVIELGRKVVLATEGATRAALLTAAKPLVAKFRQAQRKHLGEMLKKRGVDWSRGTDGTGGAGSAVKLTATVVAKPSVVRAGKPFNLVLTIRNDGTKPVYQVGALFAAYASMIDGRELLVGRMAPGKSRTVTLRCQAPPGIRERWERVQVKVIAQGAPKAAAARLLLRVLEKPRPSLRLLWQVDDRLRGNGDGVLDAGESAALVVFAQNNGAGAANDVRVDATEPVGGLVITRARAVFSKLAPQSTAVARLAIRRMDRPDPRGRRPGVTLTLYDKTLGGDVVQTIWLPRSGTPIKFEPDKRVVAPSSRSTVLYGHAGPNGQQVARVTLASRLVVEARRASVLRVALPDDRFAFVSASDVKVVAVKVVAPAAKQSSGVKPVWNVVPPRLKLTPASHEAKSAAFKVHAQAFATGGVQDLWVRVWNPESKHRAVDKLVYRAAPKAGAQKVEVSALVRLLPGTNYVAVDARDVGGAQGQRRIAVYLPKELARKGGDSLAHGTRSSAREKAARDKAASPKSQNKSGCGCRSGRGTSIGSGSGSGSGSDGATLLIGLLLLLGLWRRQRQRG